MNGDKNVKRNWSTGNIGILVRSYMRESGHVYVYVFVCVCVCVWGCVCILHIVMFEVVLM